MAKNPKRTKWTEEMNLDVLQCQRRAKEIISSDDPPLNANNGKRKGYVEVMEELWIKKGYGYLNLKGQNLRDQASRVGKLQKYSERNIENNSENINQVKNAKDSTSRSDLHITTTSFSGEPAPTKEDQTAINEAIVEENNMNECLHNDPASDPGCLPNFTKIGQANAKDTRTKARVYKRKEIPREKSSCRRPINTEAS
ncbi:hypothetical protein AC249_AIPGENE25446 [Exaiptasia diaphana]|nr:hypothetical protein AC249_AIPGENE25446 [Exaiptasia diaphana]